MFDHVWAILSPSEAEYQLQWNQRSADSSCNKSFRSSTAQAGWLRGQAGRVLTSNQRHLYWVDWGGSCFMLFLIVSRVYDKCVLRCAVAYALGCVDCGDNGWHVFEKHETESNATYLVKAGDRAFKVPCPQPQRCLPGQELQSLHRIAMASAVAFACCGLAVYQVITAYCICILTEFCMYYAHFRGLSEYRSQAEDALSEHLAASWLNHL